MFRGGWHSILARIHQIRYVEVNLRSLFFITQIKLGESSRYKRFSHHFIKFYERRLLEDVQNVSRIIVFKYCTDSFPVIQESKIKTRIPTKVC